MRRIHKIKTVKVVKETYSSETMQIIRDNCESIRDLAIIDLLASTGMRVGELVKLNKYDIDLYKYLENNDIDLVIILGDITNFGPLEFVGEFIGKIFDYDLPQLDVSLLGISVFF